jgi:2-methylisocitrate lyase-like PEP mutase family enzyme
MTEPPRDDTPIPRPRRPPAAEVIHVHPDVAAEPVDVERARDLDRDGLESSVPADAADAGARAALRARLDRAEQHRDTVAERVRELRERVNVPVIKDVDEYQGLQEQLSAALDELDQADTEVRRFRRALRRRAG